MKKYTPLDGLRWSRNSDSALNNMPQTDVLGRAGGTCPQQRCFAACSGFHDIGPAPRNPQFILNLIAFVGA